MIKDKMVGGASEQSGVLGVMKEIVRQICDGELTKEQCQLIIERKNPFVSLAAAKFPIFKTITMGVYGSVKAYRDALTKAGFRVGDCASDILNKIRALQSQVQLDLVVRTVAELGFKGATRLDRIYTKAKELGLELCPPEVGPALRLAYPGQPYDEWLRIAMDPISASVGTLSIFKVAHDVDGRWLDSSYVCPDDLWYPGHRFVFVLPRK